MNYSAYKFTDQFSGYFFYFISPFTGTDDIDLVSEQIEHYISNVPSQINHFLVTLDFGNIKIEPAQGITPLNVLNNSFPADDKNMLVSQSFISLIPPPKQPKTKKEAKGEAKPKPAKEPKPKAAPKPRGKASSKVIISNENTVVDMNN